MGRRDTAQRYFVPLVTYSDPNLFSDLAYDYVRPEVYLTAGGKVSTYYSTTNWGGGPSIRVTAERRDRQKWTVVFDREYPLEFV